MAGNADKLDSLRLNRFDSERITLALIISLAAHVIGFGGYELGKEFNFPLLRLLALAKPPLPQAQKYEEPLEFVTVEQPSTEAPQHAKYYSSHNSIAANPDTASTEQPKLNGTQTVAPTTETVLHPQFSKTQDQTSKGQRNNSQPSPSLNTGDLTLGKPTQSQQPERPRTLNQAYAMMANKMPNLMMRQNGGVQRQSFVASLDAKETPFGDYDAALIDAVTQQWYDLLDQNGYTFDRPGKVVITFRLHSDGRITDVQILQDTADDKFGGIWAILCEAALENAAPFAAWPNDYLLEQGSNYRDLRFQFNYIIP
ncbi:MAG TPA: energy transducer TonB [Candidatus Aquilonibacter sp.]|nr:energy transducer TonB [Candidatus Aquilonibacter sp.]